MDLCNTGPFPNDVELVGDVDQLPAFDLRVAQGNPFLELFRVQAEVALQGLLQGVNDEVQKVGFIFDVTISAGEYDPIGTSGRQDLGAGRFQVREQPASRAAIPGSLPGDDTVVHRLVVKELDAFVERRVDDRFE